MKNIFTFLALSFSSITSVFAFSTADIADTLHIKNRQHCDGSLERCVQVISNEKILGTLFIQSGYYRFIDAKSKQSLIVQLNAEHSNRSDISGQKFDDVFDIKDKNNQVIARLSVNERLLEVRSFTIINGAEHDRDFLKESDSIYFDQGDFRMPLERTYYGIGHSLSPLVILHQPTFTWNRDSIVTINNKSELFSQINPNAFVAALAFECLQAELSPIEIEESASTAQVLYSKLKHFSEKRGLTDDQGEITENDLKAASAILDENYPKYYSEFGYSYSEAQKIYAFINLGFTVIDLNICSNKIEEKALIQILRERVRLLEKSK